MIWKLVDANPQFKTAALPLLEQRILKDSNLVLMKTAAEQTKGRLSDNGQPMS